ncbi:signal peptidase II [Rubellimicrobium roseum]|uniref:Lipoprotein signal peptidase n=1 Tax=Rubellimicrobium roseum TaxID=687525 RepID=A0A5C4NI86_9RHOB|nr:signal peptidase II [Rubellimicrobium roseum]TNC72397.1 signal peptidase II [Rubellimicrobium roseum]
MPKLRQPPAPTRLMIWTIFWVFLLDQATKWLVVHWLDLRTRLEIDVLPPFVNFRMAWNRGVNFGLLAEVDMRWVLVALAVVISVAVVVWVLREGGSRLVHLSAGLLVGGAMGNVVDRLLYGAVADFLNMSCCGIENPYAFNVADIAVFAGAVGLVLFAGGGKGGAQGTKPPKPAPKPASKPAKTG